MRVPIPIILTVFILIFGAAGAFALELVGRGTLGHPGMRIEVDFYDGDINAGALREMLKRELDKGRQEYIPATGLRLVMDDLAHDILTEYLRNLYLDNPNLSLTWGAQTDYMAIKYTFSYRGNKYFGIWIVKEKHEFFFFAYEYEYED